MNSLFNQKSFLSNPIDESNIEDLDEILSIDSNVTQMTTQFLLPSQSVTQQDSEHNDDNNYSAIEGLTKLPQIKFLSPVTMDSGISFNDDDSIIECNKENDSFVANNNEYVNPETQTQELLAYNPTPLNCSQIPLKENTCSNKLSWNSAFSSINVEEEFFNELPVSILNLYKTIRREHTYWSFIYAVSAQLGQDIFPFNCFVNLKMALLMSLVSIQPIKKSVPIPIMAIGKEGLSIQLLMKHIGSLSKRFISTTTNEVTGATLTKENKIEAGSLLLASSGVLYLGNWTILKSSVTNLIQRTIDSSSVMVPKVIISSPLECAIWSYWDGLKCPKKNINALMLFLNIFGLPIIVLDDDQPDNLVDFILEGSGNGQMQVVNDEFNILSDDMKQVIRIIQKIEAQWMPEAEDLLKNYFIAKRLEQPNVLTQRTFIMLQQMAESHAKICLRSKIFTCDVIGAIYMVERFVQTICGPGFLPSPIAEQSIKDFNGVDEYMERFQQWTFTYIKIVFEQKQCSI